MPRDPLTEAPPPSRFDPEELQVFLEDHGSDGEALNLPPIVVWAHQQEQIQTRVLLVCISSASCTLLHHLPGKRLIGSILLPELPMSGNCASPSPTDRSCCIYELGSPSSVLAVAVQYTVPPSRCFAWVSSLFRNILADSVLVLDALPQRLVTSAAVSRGGETGDGGLLFALETDKMRRDMRGEDMPGVMPLPRKGRSIPPLPSGCLVDGLPSAVLTHCQLRDVAARLVLTWPDEVKLVSATLRDCCLLPDSLGFEEAAKASVGMRVIPKHNLYC